MDAAGGWIEGGVSQAKIGLFCDSRAKVWAKGSGERAGTSFPLAACGTE
jgi:hypothetical protein